MAMPAFQNLEVDFWIHKKKLGVTQPTVCLFHRLAQTGGQLLDALTELNGKSCPSQRTLTFVGCPRKSVLRKLTFLVVAERDDLKVLNIRHEGEGAIMEMTHVGVNLLTNAFSKWLAGAEDFGVSPRHASLKPKRLGRLDFQSGELWFWGPQMEP